MPVLQTVVDQATADAVKKKAREEDRTVSQHIARLLKLNHHIKISPITVFTDSSLQESKKEEVSINQSNSR